MRISITLPSLHLDLVHRTLENLSSATIEHDIEVLVCSPSPVPEGSWVRWIRDEKQSGCVAAHAAAARAATGDLITSFADDHDYVRGWDKIAVENFLRREKFWRRVSWPHLGGPFSLGLRQISPTPHVGTMFGIYYPYFPLMRLEEAREIGGWYDAELYRNGFSDPDLGLRVWACGGRCEWADQATIATRPEDQARKGAPNYLDDAVTFLKAWQIQYGEGWDLRHVRGWDLDVPLDTFGPEERTCFRDERVRKYVRATEDV